MSWTEIVNPVTGRIQSKYLPPPAGAPNLEEVLLAGNSAGGRSATNFGIIANTQLQTGSVVKQQNQPALQIGQGNDALVLQNAVAKGSIVVGDALFSRELTCPTTTTAATTSSIFNWLNIANGQSKTFTFSNASAYQLGYSITITYSGTDSITGTITAITGNDVTLTITAFTRDTYSVTNILATNPVDPSTTATSGGSSPTFLFNSAVTTPFPPDVPANTFLLFGECFFYKNAGGLPNTMTISVNSPAVVRPTTNTITLLPYQDPPTTPTAFSFSAEGCFITTAGLIELPTNTGNSTIAFGWPTGGGFLNQDFCGFITGYTLAYTPNGIVSINSKLVLTADSTKPLGVFWGVDAQGVGTVTSVTGGNNITMSGSLSAPVVNVSSPLTSNLAIGGTAITGSSGGNNLTIVSGSVQLSNPASNMTTTITPSTNQIQYFTASPVATGLYSSTAGQGSASYVAGATLGGDSCILRTEVAASTGATIDLETVSGTNKTFDIKSEGGLRLTSAYNTIQNQLVLGVGTNGTTITGQGFTSNQGPAVTNTLSAGSNIILATSTTGSAANHNLIIGAAGMQTTKFSKTGANVVGGETIALQSVWAKDAGGTEREWTRIQTAVEDATAGLADSTLSVWNSVNGVMSQTFNFNGGQNENNSFRPLDMNGNDIRTTSGNLAVNTSLSSGAGNISLLPKQDGNITMTCGGGGGAGVISASTVNGNINLLTTGTGDIQIDAEDVARLRGKAGLTLETTLAGGADIALTATRTLNITTNSINSAGNRLNIATGTNGGIALTGAALQSATAGGNSGQHLVITLNGVVYKIKLENA